jgi:hypothetical protein
MKKIALASRTLQTHRSCSTECILRVIGNCFAVEVATQGGCSRAVSLEKLISKMRTALMPTASPPAPIKRIADIHRREDGYPPFSIEGRWPTEKPAYVKRDQQFNFHQCVRKVQSNLQYTQSQ